jgi:hypothetical protein
LSQFFKIIFYYKVVRTTEGQHNVVQRDYLWGTNVSVVDLENDVRNFFENFRVNEDDELPYYKKLMINVFLYIKFQ